MAQLNEWEKFYSDEKTIKELVPLNIAYPDVMKVILTYTQKDSRCLEIGCGSGTYTVEIEKNGRRCIGFDQSRAGLAITKQKGKLYNLDIETVQGDAYDTKFPDNSFDMIFSDGVLEHLDKQRVINEIYRITKPGGYVITKLPAKTFLYDIVHKMTETETFHADETLITMEEWIDLFKNAGFKSVQSEMCGGTNISLVRRIFKTTKYDKVTPNFFKIYYLIVVQK